MNNRFLPILNKRYPQSLQNCLSDFQKSWEELDKLSKLTENWGNIIGLELAKECKPLKIEQKILIVAVNHPQWRQALIYNKHRLKENIKSRIGITLKEIKIIQHYNDYKEERNIEDAKLVWENHPSRVKKNNMVICKFCNCPSPKGEIKRWGKCTFCWRKNS